jgi:RNA polymerase sigma factor (sigma-70 family)
MGRVKAGSVDAIWELVERYAGHIQAVVRRYMSRTLRPLFDSHDFMQDLFVSVIRIHDRLDELDTPQRLIAVLGAMARNKVIDEVRKRNYTERHGIEDQVHLSTLPVETMEECVSDDPTASQVAVARERWDRMLAGESARDQRILTLRLEGRSMEEIGEQLAVNEKTVRRVLERLLRGKV